MAAIAAPVGDFPAELEEAFDPGEAAGTRGSTGTVFRVTRREDGAVCALKVLDRCRDDAARDRAAKEAAALAEIEHPALVPILAHGRLEGGVPWVATRWMEGAPLAELAPGDALRALCEVGAGLEVLHEKGFVHGDVRPQNVLLPEGGDPVLVGPSVSVDGRPKRAEDAGDHPGFPQFMSPQLWLLKSFTVDADWYAWGVTAFWLWEGSLPFTREDLSRAGIVQSLPRVKLENLDRKSELGKLILGLITFVPQDRSKAIQSASEVLAGAEAPPLPAEHQALEREPLPAPVPVVRKKPPAAPKPPKVSPESRWRAFLIALVAAIVGWLVLAS